MPKRVVIGNTSKGDEVCEKQQSEQFKRAIDRDRAIERDLELAKAVKELSEWAYTVKTSIEQLDERISRLEKRW